MSEDNRKSVRFYPGEKEIAVVSMNLGDLEKYDIIKYDFKGEFCALIVDESHTGCSLIFLDHNDRASMIYEGSRVIVQLGHLLPARAEVVWKKELDEKLIKIGLKILD